MAKPKQKGKRGELEAAKLLSDILGLDIKRGVQYKGSQDSPDLLGLDKIGLHCEVKRTESAIALATYKAIDQAISDSGENVPFVLSRRNRKEWLVVIRLADLIEFCKRIESATS